MNPPSRLEQLVSPLGGLISWSSRVSTTQGLPSFIVYYAGLGDLTGVLFSIRQTTSKWPTPDEILGAGVDLDDQTALTRALAEALERYCSCVYSPRQLISASAEQLGDEALDLDQVPRCSERELTHSLCPLQLPDKTKPIRWVRGISLMTRKQVWIPAVMVYLGIPRLNVGEDFVLPISTGCAAHPTVAQALVNGICEVIERDAVAVVWLQQLPLPQIEIDLLPPTLAPYLEAYGHSHIKLHLLDATTDLGVPTIYAIEVAPYDGELTTLVACATALDPIHAITKVICDLIAYRSELRRRAEIPSDPDLFSKPFHGAKYMGRPEFHEVFRFLLDSPDRHRLTHLPMLETGDPAKNLTILLQRLREHGIEAFAVDLTTDEALRANMRVVRVIIPKLQPLTFRLKARYLAHPRLYEAPQRMGYRVQLEDDINAWPQPFG